MGERPCYIDGHQHVHLYPCLTETVASVMEELHITKTRFLSEDMNEVSWMNTNPRKAFRQLIYQNVFLSLLPSLISQTLLAIPVYNKHHVFGGYGIGSSIGGMAMTAQRIINCCLRYPRSRSKVTTIELMVVLANAADWQTHPAIPHADREQWGCGIGCDDFSQSEDRVHEHSVLVDPNIRQNLLDKGIRLCSYATSHIGADFESNSRSNSRSNSSGKLVLGNGKRIVMMLSMKEGTGNTITGTRIASVLMELGFVVQMVDTTDHFESQNMEAILHNQRYNEGSTLYRLFCIHALRAGVFALSTNVPYVLMLGGTDINVNIHDPTKVDRVKDVLLHAHHIIAFTESMKQRTLDLLSDSTCPPITVIPQVSISIQPLSLQSTEIPHSPDSSLRTSLGLTSSHQLLVLPSGLRPVSKLPLHQPQIKDVLFLLDAFSKYHKLHPNVVLCIIGPILDPAYANSLFARLPNENIIGISYTDKKESDLYEGVYYST